MFIAIGALIFLLFLGFAIKRSKRMLYSDFSTDTTLPEFEAQFKKLARTFVLPESHGKGVELQPAAKYINKAYRLIKRKLIKGGELFEFERWLYDNHYIFTRVFKNNSYESFCGLPHIGETPRVVIFARAIVSLTEGKINAGRVDAALNAVNNVAPLTYPEIEKLDAALVYAALEKLASVSRKCIYYRKMLNIAVRAKNVAKKYANDNLYIYYTIKKNPVIAEKLKDYMDANAKKYDNIDYTFSALIVENNILTSALITSLINIGGHTAHRFELMPVTAALNKDEVYKQMDVASKKLYLAEISRLSDKLNMDEAVFAERLLRYAADVGQHFGILLFEGGKTLLKNIKADKRVIVNEKERRGEVPYILLNAFFVAALAGAAFASIFAAAPRSPQLLAAAVLIAAFGIIGLLAPAYGLSNRVAKLFVKNRPVCRMAYSDIPDCAATEIVVPVYVSDEKSLRNNVTHLNRIALANRFSNLKFTLLIDFKASDAEKAPDDGYLLSILKAETENKNICAAVRKRVYNGSDYSGRERKRGAVEDYASYLMTGSGKAFEYLSGKHWRPVYFVVLDADNTLAPQAVLRLVNTFLHPLNSRYDLLAMSGRINISSIKNAYSKRFLRDGGRENYPEYSSFFNNLAGNALFTGKGIFKLGEYYSKLNGALPEGKILSHDLLEGALLETGLAGETAYEDAPTGFQSDEDRRLRWLRGDIQLLPFLNITKTDNNNQKMRLFYRFLMFLNAFSAFYPAYITALFLTAAFLNLPYLAVFAAAVFALEFALDVFTGFFGIFISRRFRYYAADVFRGFCGLMFKFILLPYYAAANTALFAATVFRMTVTKKGLLKWKTFASTQADSSLRTKPDKKTSAALLKMAADTYGYFENAVVSGLIADNFQVYPKNTAVNYTSPTNIGFSLIAEAAALKLGFKEYGAAEQKTNEILERVLKLKKWNGHLYNWYDLTAGKPLPPSFVSSVDSGNFIASLLLIRNIFGKKTRDIIENYLKTVNFKSLFDDKKQQFYIGYNAQKRSYEGHYDNLISEARLLAYLGVCFGLPAASWDSLSRDYTSLKGNTLLSWSGTAFEYLLPDLFIKPSKYSLTGRTSRNAAAVMRRTKCKGLWGISESGYFDFDDNRNYKYLAFGIDSLSLKSELNKCVISPYSSFLALEYAPKAVMRNVEKLKKAEAYGEYGFYEAVDFTRAPRLVLEYMAHHQGMTLMAIADYLTENSLSNAFSRDDTVASSEILLSERQYEGKTFRPEKNKFIYEERGSNSYEKHIGGNRAVPSAAILKSGDYTVVADDWGCGYSRFGDIAINRFRRDFSKLYGAFFYVVDCESGVIQSPSRAPLNADGEYKTIFGKTEIRYCNPEAGLTQTVHAPNFFNGELRRLLIENKSAGTKKYKVVYYSELCLNTEAADLSHRTFSNLFVETDVKEDVLYAVRRGEEKGRGIYFALYVKGADGSYIGNRYNFLGRGGSLQSPRAVTGFKKRGDDNGTVLDPCAAFIGEVEIEAGGTREIEIYSAISHSAEGISAEIKRAKNPHFSEFVKKIPYVAENSRLYDLDCRHADYLTRLTPELLYKPYPQEKLYNICASHKLFVKLSGNFAKKILLLKYGGNRHDLKQATRIVNLLQASGIAVCLAVWYEERDSYYTPVKSEIMRTIEGCVAGRDVFLISNAEMDYDILRGICFRDFSAYEDCVYKVCNPEMLFPEKTRVEREAYFVTGEGYFSKEGYEVAPFGKATLLPYSNVICGEYGGTVISGNGGYTYFGNSRESKLTEWCNDFTLDEPSECLLMETDKGVYRLNGDGAHASHIQGMTTKFGEYGSFNANVSEYIIDGGRAKVYETDVYAVKKFEGSLILNMDLILGAYRDKSYIYYKIQDGVYEAVNLKNGISCYMKALNGEFLAEYLNCSRGSGCQSSAIGDISYTAAVKVRLSEGECGKYFFVFGGDYETVAGADYESVCRKKRESLSYFQNLNPFAVKTGNKAFDILFNECLMYQTVSCRINGRTSFYQAGGATGFRDRLQDCLAYIYCDAEKARALILEIASHTYFEGDVMHWWHGEKHGVRTRISDDRLFLPYVATEYIKMTGDRDILEEEVFYLAGRPLSAGEESRYENPDYMEKTDTLLLHLERIADSAYRLGENGLLLIDGGDWNDALNKVGTPQAGESVWLTMFYIDVLNRMQSLYAGKEKLVWLDRAERLKKAVEDTFTGRQYKRLVTASGEWLGDGYSKVMNIDILTQAWASLADIGNKKYRDLALNAAKNSLYDKKYGLIKLLSPPFDSNSFYGYISLYPEGVRENGGQYTHAAIWFLSALCREGRVDEAFELFSAINPLNKCASEEGAREYKGEPYVLAADVYSNAQHKGRAGWTWYTGSASWCYKLILEDFLGIRLSGGNLEVKPNPPKAFDKIEVVYKYKNSVYNIKMTRTGRQAFFENGVEYKNGSVIKLGENENRNFTINF